MKVTREESAARREQIVEIASELFRIHGFDGVAISDIMKAVGVTHGGFYGHFESKEQLAAEACTRANTRNRWDRYMDGPVHQRLGRIVGGYLSERTSHAFAPAMISAPARIAPHRIATWLFFIDTQPGCRPSCAAARRR